MNFSGFCPRWIPKRYINLSTLYFCHEHYTCVSQDFVHLWNFMTIKNILGGIVLRIVPLCASQCYSRVYRRTMSYNHRCNDFVHHGQQTHQKQPFVSKNLFCFYDNHSSDNWKSCVYIKNTNTFKSLAIQTSYMKLLRTLHL